jgi:hypothetical protein
VAKGGREQQRSGVAVMASVTQDIQRLRVIGLTKLAACAGLLMSRQFQNRDEYRD